MEKRYGVLRALCYVQIYAGAILIVLAVGAPLVMLASNPSDLPSDLVIIAGVLGGIFVGLSLIATAQVYQCLMQVEINTRPRNEAPVADEAHDLSPVVSSGTLVQSRS